MKTKGQLIAALVGVVALGSSVPADGQQRQKKPANEAPAARKTDRERPPDCNGFRWHWPTRKRAYLGVQLLRLTPELRTHFGAPDSAGLLVAKVEPNGPAAGAGVKVGDLLLTVDGERVDGLGRVVRALRRRGKGDRIKLRVLRGGKPRTLEATLDVRETPQIEVGTFFRSFSLPGTGRGGVGFEGFDPRCLDRTMRKLRRQMREAQPGQRIFRYMEREQELERRLQEMERKLHKLERRLQTRRGKSWPTAA